MEGDSVRRPFTHPPRTTTPCCPEHARKSYEWSIFSIQKLITVILLMGARHLLTFPENDWFDTASWSNRSHASITLTVLVCASISGHKFSRYRTIWYCMFTIRRLGTTCRPLPPRVARLSTPIQREGSDCYRSSAKTLYFKFSVSQNTKKAFELYSMSLQHHDGKWGRS